MTAADAVVVAVTAHGLAGSRVERPVAPLDPARWRDLVERCRTADLCGFLAAAVVAGGVPATDDQRAEACLLEVEWAARSLLVDQRVRTMSAMLTAGGIDHRVLGGPACHHLAYGGSSLRTYGAAELLVRPEELPLVTRLPGAPDGPSAPGTGSSSLAFRSDLLAGERAGEPVRLHQLSPGATFTLAGQVVVAPMPHELLVAACLELAADGGSARWPVRVRDVAELALSHRLDPAAARARARAWGVADVMAEMIAFVWHVLDLADKTELSVWAGRLAGARGPGGRAQAPGRGSLRGAPADAPRRLLGRRLMPTGGPDNVRRSS